MEADRRRKIKSGEEFDDLFPSPLNRDISIRKDADVKDTIELIQRTVPKTLWQTRKIAEKLRGRTLDETCSNIWHFVYDHIQYKHDKEGVEQVRSPRRTWWERFSGVDCDCYTEFIGSVLLNLGIPHKARITKYPKLAPEIPRWQHIYPIVPKDGRLDREFTDRDSYIVIDCVKDDYDDEQPFLEYKDYDMKLEYLDGIDDDQNISGPDYETTDLNDLAALYDDDHELGRFSLKNTFKKIGDGLKNGVRFLNRYANPGTVLLRNGLLLAMKINLFNVAGKLRYAYLSDAQAKALGINTDALNKLRHVRDRAESIYWQAGGKKENLKKAILKGKGNHDKKVPLNGLFGLDDEYADVDEYNIIHQDNYDELMGLGELGIVGTTALAAATSAVAALGAALKQIKGVFSKGSKEEQAFQSTGDKSTPSATSKGDDSNASAADSPADESNQSNQTLISKIASGARMATQDNETNSSSTSDSGTDSSAQSVLPATTNTGRAALTSDDPPANASLLPATSDQATEAKLPATTKDTAQLQSKDPNQPSGLMDKTTAWVKDNPGKSLLLVGAVVGGGFLILKSMHKKSPPSSGGLSGLPSKIKRKHKPRKKRKARKQKIKSIKL